MGREAALHDAAERERKETWGWAIWMAVQIVCALLFVGFLIALLFLRARPPAGLVLVPLAIVLFVGGRALWRLAEHVAARRSRGG